MGCVETGVIKHGRVVTYAPVQLSIEVKSNEVHHESIPEAVPGDNSGFNVKKVSMKNIKCGHITSNSENKHGTQGFIVQVVVLNHPRQISNGYSSVLDYQTVNIVYKFTKILEEVEGPHYDGWGVHKMDARWCSMWLLFLLLYDGG